jgi:hypothetical protein
MHSADGASGSSEKAQKENTSDVAVEEQHKQAVVWLLLAAPAVATTADRLSHVLNMTTGWALQLVKAGVRITYAQLLAAARSMVAGVEVWVQAQQQLAVHTDIPDLAVAVCCASAKVSLWSCLGPVIALAVSMYVINVGLDCTLCLKLRLHERIFGKRTYSLSIHCPICTWMQASPRRLCVGVQ